MNARPPRRPEFDSITMGWGADRADDLQARLHLLDELKAMGQFTPAERKIEDAMRSRLGGLVR